MAGLSRISKLYKHKESFVSPSLKKNGTLHTSIHPFIIKNIEYIIGIIILAVAIAAMFIK